MQANDCHDVSLPESQILHPGSRALFRYWEALRAENAAPSHESLDLKQIAGIVPDLFLMDRDYLRHSYKWRLAGTRICTLFGRELTNNDALEGWDSFERRTIQQLLDGVVTALQPCLLRFRLTTNVGHVIGAELIGLPLHARHTGQFHVLGGVFCFNGHPERGHESIVAQELSGARTIWTEHLPGDKLVASLAQAPRPQPNLKVITGGRT
jgi:hypothetical protein